MALANRLNEINQTLVKLEKIFGSADDIHKHTKSIGEGCQQALLIDNEQGLSNTETSFEDVAKEISKVANECVGVQANNVEKVLATIRTNGAVVEAETGVNVQDLLIRTWVLASRVPYENAKAIVCDNLSNNIENAGGCFAGISGRLAQPYLHFVKAALEAKQDDVILRKQSFEARPEEDYELQLALALSKSSHEEEQKAEELRFIAESPIYTNAYEDDFNRAIAESLRTTSAPASDTTAEDDPDLAYVLKLSSLMH